jgi:PPOX class probable F420-dependent enzyme
MDTEEARQFLRDNHNAVICTIRQNGDPAMSPITVGVDDDGFAIVSSRETAFKVKNLRRDPWAQLCAFTDRFFGPWIYAEGRAEVVSLPEAMEPLIDYYKRFPGENPDWEDYRERMRREQRVLIRITLEHAGPDRQG